MALVAAHRPYRPGCPAAPFRARSRRGGSGRGVDTPGLTPSQRDRRDWSTRPFARGEVTTSDETLDELLLHAKPRGSKEGGEARRKANSLERAGRRVVEPPVEERDRLHAVPLVPALEDVVHQRSPHACCS